jgi:phenylpyruvate tautomerase PptA (4-oxalocrotonate tautomerase family)
MPFVQVHTARPVSPELQRTLGAALARLYGERMQTTHRIVNVGFLQYAAGALARYDETGDAPREMTVVTCDVRAGRPPETLEALGRAITSLCSRELSVPDARVAVYITEHAAHHIYRDGGRAPEWSPEEGSPRLR